MAGVKISHKITLCCGCLLMLVLVGLILFGQNGYRDYMRLKAQKDILVMKNNATEEENSLLRHRAGRLQNDDKYIEYIARKELGMIAGDEVVYKFKGAMP